MINKTDVERIKLRYQLSTSYPDNMITELCQYWLKQNKENQIQYVVDFHENSHQIFMIKKKINELIDVVNEMRENDN